MQVCTVAHLRYALDRVLKLFRQPEAKYLHNNIGKNIIYELFMFILAFERENVRV